MEALFTCSIDDGHPTDMRTADILDKHNLNATFYMPIRNREGPAVLGPSDIRTLAQRFEIGSHTHDHCFLRDLPPDAARHQIEAGKQQLEDMLGDRVEGFCYPGGKYRKEHAAMVEAAGFRYARTTRNLCFDAGERPFEMPTTIQFYPHSRDVYLRNYVKGGGWRQRGDGLKLALQHPHWLDRLYALFDHALERQRVFHLWAHSKDIDEHHAWHEFERFLAYAASRIPRRNRLDNAQLALREKAERVVTT
jgi:peptidoglycan/xylan/chitin deacetylase (PgdA/CDA1 family)